MKEFWIKVWNGLKTAGRAMANKDMWCKVGRFCLKLLTIPNWLIVILVLVTVVALCYVFINHMNTTVIAVIAYGVSAYTLGAVCVVFPAMVRFTRMKVLKSKSYNKISNHAFTIKIKEDRLYRGRVMLYKGMITSMSFACFKLVVSWLYRSVWFGSVAVYYIALSGIRYMLVKYIKSSDCITNKNQDADIENDINSPDNMRMVWEYKAYRLCGYLMILTNIAMGGMTVQMVIHDKGYSYPGIIIYVSAMYSFVSLAMAIKNIFTYRKLSSPIITAAKAVSFAGALMSILALQTAMIAQFGGGETFRRVMNGCTGGVIYFIILTCAVLMIRKANKYIKANAD